MSGYYRHTGVGTFECHVYPAGHAPRGWNIAPFVRYANMDISSDYSYHSQDDMIHLAHEPIH